MRLVPISEEDLDLYEKMFCSPEHMRFLGGPVGPETAAKYLKAHMRCNSNGSGMVFKFIPESGDWGDEDLSSELVALAEHGVGTVCIWHSEYKDEPVTEVGWGVLPQFQGRGFATTGVRQALKLAQETPDTWKNFHVFTDLRNEPSIRMCRSLGFSFVGECEVDYNDIMMKVHHFVLP